MAKLDSRGHLKGSIGPVMYRSFYGNTYLQTKPGPGIMKQTTATKQSASDFGRASSVAKAIRTALFPIMQGHSDSGFYRRFTAKVNTATQDGNPQPKGSRNLIDGNLSLLEHIDCNSASPFDLYCKLTSHLTLSDDRQLTIRLPEFRVLEQITPHKEATDAELVFLVTSINPETNSESHAELFRLPLVLEDVLIPEQQWTSQAVPENHLIVVASAVFYYRRNALAGMMGLNGSGFHPCEVSMVLRS